MWKNLYQKTIYEVYKSKEHLGYRFFETEEMFAMLWNDQRMSRYNMVHCRKFGPEELAFLRENVPNTFFCVASGIEIKDKTLPLKKGTPSYLMVLNLQGKMKEEKLFKIMRVTDKKTLSDFCDVITEVYDIKKEDRASLSNSFIKEMDLEGCARYVGYIDEHPAGAVEFSEGKEAVCVSWGSVKKEFRKQGLYKAMLIYAANYEIDRGFKAIVLNSSEMGRAIYAKMGFVPLAHRYNYTLEK